MTTKDLEKFLIREIEYIKPDIALIKEAVNKGDDIILTGILQKANTLNRNGRVYPLDILKREAQKYMQEIEEGGGAGELDHPDSAIVSMANVSHRVIDMWWEGEALYGKIKVSENTTSGKNLKGLLLDGHRIGISSRGVGSVKNKGGKDIVQNDFELIAFDIVSSPSTPGAYMFQESAKKGLFPLDSNSLKILRYEDLNNYKNLNLNENEDIVEKLNNLLNDDFWKKI